MPNTLPPIATADDAARYRDEIIKSTGPAFTPLMTIKITPTTTPSIVEKAAAAGVIAGKLYPEGVTTNSSDGVNDVRELAPVFAAMEKSGLVLCLHGEDPNSFVLDRERIFVEKTLPWIVETFPSLRIVLEHVSSEAAVAWVNEAPPRVAATIAAPHLFLTLEDVVGGMLHPHHFCKPLPKYPADRDAVTSAAVSANSRFFLGTDSAPHPRTSKETSSGCAGVFSAPVVMPLLAQLFEEHSALDRLQRFTSENGALFYGLELNPAYITLVKSAWKVPDVYGEVVPLAAGTTIRWTLKEFE